MRAIDFSPRNYPKKSVFRKKSKKKFFSIFREYAINVTPPLMIININQMVIQNLDAEIIQLMAHTHQLKGSKTI